MDTGILDSLLTFVATVGGSYLVFRGQLARVKTDAEAERVKLQAELERVKAEREAASRDDRRDDFKVITDSQAGQIKELQDTVRYLRAVAETNQKQITDLTRENGGLREKIVELEGRIARKELCPLAREGKCPSDPSYVMASTASKG